MATTFYRNRETLGPSLNVAGELEGPAFRAKSGLMIYQWAACVFIWFDLTFSCRKIWTRSATSSSWRPTASNRPALPVPDQQEPLIMCRTAAGRSAGNTGRRCTALPSSRVISYRHRVRWTRWHRLADGIRSTGRPTGDRWFPTRPESTTWWTTIAILFRSPADQASLRRHSSNVSRSTANSIIESRRPLVQTAIIVIVMTWCMSVNYCIL